MVPSQLPRISTIASPSFPEAPFISHPPSTPPEPPTLGRIETARLSLIPMSAEFLRALIAGQPQRAGEIAGIIVPAAIQIPEWIMRLRLETLLADPTAAPWLLRAVVLRETQTMIGDTGFHGRPGAQHLRELCDYGVELGYSIAPPHRRRGYAREAVSGLLDWARDSQAVRSFVLSISPENTASIQFATSMGFSPVPAYPKGTNVSENIFLKEW